MSEVDRISALILERLTGPQNAFRAELAELVVEQLLQQPVREVIDLEPLRAALLHGLRAENVRRIVEQHVAPAFERYARAVAGSNARVGSLVSPTAHQKLHAVVRKLQLPEARWAENALDPTLLRLLLRPVWTQVLSTFAKRLPVPGVAAVSGAGPSRPPSGLTGFLTRSVQEQAEKLIDRGRNVMGGLGAEVERRLSAAARDFSDAAAQAFRESLIERLHSDEGSELLGQLLAGLTDHVLRTRFADLQVDVNAMPLAEIFDSIPDLVSYAVRSNFVEEVASREFAAWLELQGERPVAELLAEYGLLDEVRELLVQRAAVVADGLAANPRFAAWLAALVREDDKPE